MQLATEPVISIHQEEGVTATSIRYYVLGRQPEPALTHASWKQSAKRILASQILGHRFAALAQDSASPILNGSASAWWWHDLPHGVASVTVREDAVPRRSPSWKMRFAAL